MKSTQNHIVLMLSIQLTKSRLSTEILGGLYMQERCTRQEPIVAFLLSVSICRRLFWRSLNFVFDFITNERTVLFRPIGLNLFFFSECIFCESFPSDVLVDNYEPITLYLNHINFPYLLSYSIFHEKIFSYAFQQLIWIDLFHFSQALSSFHQDLQTYHITLPWLSHIVLTVMFKKKGCFMTFFFQILMW